MNKNLSKRIFTSIILSAVLLICLFFHKYSWLILLISASITCFFEFNNLSKKVWKRKRSSIYLANLISIFYLIFFTFSAYEIYNASFKAIILVILICIFSDIGGYVVGKSVGGKKLTKISPNKTVSGSVGSFIFSFTPIMIISLIYELTKKNEFQIHHYEIDNLIFLCLITSLMCQLGDLFISYFKRKAKIKDTGSILPGHGGLLDRIDGIIFAIPGVFLIDKIFF